MSGENVLTLANYLLELKDDGIDPNDQLLDYLVSPDVEKLKVITARLGRVRNLEIKGNSKRAKSRKAKRNQLVGKIFEKWIAVVLEGCIAFQHDGNIQTTSAEIDFRILILPLAKVIPLVRRSETHLIGEAKCTANTLVNGQ